MSRIAYEVARRVTYALNRPRLAWLGRAAQDVALRLNGVSINFVRAGESLSISEQASRRSHQLQIAAAAEDMLGCSLDAGWRAFAIGILEARIALSLPMIELKRSPIREGAL